MAKKPKRAARASLSAKKWAGSAIEAGKALGVSRRTISTWLLEDGNPGKSAAGKFNLEEWREWRDDTHPGHDEKKEPAKHEPPELTRKQQIELELREIDLRAAKRKELEDEGRMMETDTVDGFLFEVLASYDFHMANAERSIIMTVAKKFKVVAETARKIIKPGFDVIRTAFNDSNLPAEAKRNLIAWHAIPEATRAKILAGTFPAKGRK